MAHGSWTSLPHRRVQLGHHGTRIRALSLSSAPFSRPSGRREQVTPLSQQIGNTTFSLAQRLVWPSFGSSCSPRPVGCAAANADDPGPSSLTKAASRSARVCVLGAGVVGLTTALRLLKRLPNASVTILAERFGGDTTTAGAAGVWQPYKLSETPEDLVDRWGAETFDHLVHLVHSEEAEAAGVSMCYCTSVHLEPQPDPFWKDSVFGFKRLSQRELDLFSSTVDWDLVAAAAKRAAATAGAAAMAGGAGKGAAAGPTTDPPTKFVDGYSFNTVVCEGRLYMQWLIQQIRAAGGVLQHRRVEHIGDLEPEGWDLVINCCGLGSKELMSDPYCYPIRGQITKVRAPWVTQAVFAEFPDETAYIIPNREWVVMGGTGQVGNWDMNASLTDAEQIATRCSQLLPSLLKAEVLSQWVGLRPGRVRLRLEAGRVTGGAVQSIGFEDEDLVAVSAGREGDGLGGSAMAVVSNYGHGGSGLTLAWGTAGDAVELAAAQLTKKGLYSSS